MAEGLQERRVLALLRRCDQLRESARIAQLYVSMSSSNGVSFCREERTEVMLSGVFECRSDSRGYDDRGSSKLQFSGNVGNWRYCGVQ